MGEILEIFRKVTIRPYSDRRKYKMITYYSELSKNDRERRDFRNTDTQRVGGYYERVFPIASTS